MCCASLTTRFNTVSLLLSSESITIQLFLLFPSWNQLPGMASNQQLVTEVTEACYTVFFCILYVLPERRCSVWGSLHPHFSLVQCLMIEKHLWWPLIASCRILIGNVWHFPCNWWSIAFKLWSSNWDLKKKQTGTHGFTPCCCIGYGWVLFSLFWDLKTLEMFVLPTYNMYLD